MNDIVETALKYLGAPGRNGNGLGNSPDGFDCSGFVQYVLNEAGVIIPSSPVSGEVLRFSEEFFDFFGLLVHDELRAPGDLVFFSWKGTRPSHLGIYKGNDEVIHIPGLPDATVMISPLENLCKAPKYDPTIGPQLYVRNPIGYKRPTIPTKGKRYQRCCLG